MSKSKQEADFDTFVAGFRKSASGTLWRKYDRATVSVFHRKGRFSWCISYDDEPEFSKEKFECEIDALVALAKELFVV